MGRCWPLLLFLSACGSAPPQIPLVDTMPLPSPKPLVNPECFRQRDACMASVTEHCAQERLDNCELEWLLCSVESQQK